MILSSDDKKLTLVCTQKAGCSTAVKTFFDYVGFKYDPNAWIHDERLLHYKNVPHKDEYISYQVVRNPYTRAVASYLHCLRYNLEKTYVRRLSFLRFIRNLSPSRLDSHGNAHCIPQYCMPVQYILKLESIDEDVKTFHLKTGINLVLNNVQGDHSLEGRIKNSFLEPKVRGREFFDINPCIKGEAPSPYRDYSDFYDNEIRDLVEKIYHKDLDYFGYKYPFQER